MIVRLVRRGRVFAQDCFTISYFITVGWGKAFYYFLREASIPLSVGLYKKDMGRDP